MSDTLTVVARVFAEWTNLDPSDVTSSKHIFTDLGVDSLDFLDIVFDLDKAFGVKLPVEEWLAQVEQDQTRAQQLFVIQNLVDYIDKQRSSQTASA